MSETVALSERRRRLLQELLSGAVVPEKPGERVGPRALGETIPLSPEQKHVWLHASMASDVPLYNEAITIHRNGSFDRTALEKSLNEILRRHEIWRSAIELRDGGPCLVVQPPPRLAPPLTDVSDLPEAEREAAALRIATEDALKPFDLAQAPLLRARIVRLAPDKHRLYFTLHHIIFDGVSIYRLIVPELSRLYDAYARGAEPDLPEPSLQYGDYAVWRERQLASGTIERERQYWRKKLSGELPQLMLPADRKQPPVSSHRGAMETFRLAPDITAALKEFSRREGVTLYAILLAAFKALLHRYSGQEDIVIGGVTDTRRRPELENVVGYFLNSVALRTQPRGATSFRQYLHEVQSTVVEALDASNVPFDRVVRDIAPKRDGSRHPLFQVLFSIEPPAPEFPQGWALTQMDVTIGVAKFDLYLELDQEPDSIIGRFLYAADLFDASTIRRMIGHWQTLIAGMLHDPDCALAKLPLLTAVEQREIHERNQTASDFPDTDLYRWIEAQANQHADAIAAECGGEAWSYGELIERARALAARLRAAGAGNDVLVGIAMRRSLEMVAGLLAILRSGAAYLPLDPDLPEARLRLLLEDAQPAIILTDPMTRAKLPSTDASLILGDAPDASAVGDDAPLVDPDDLAYVLYTSGSTGRPKAVEIRHRSVVNLLAAVGRDLSFGRGDTFLALTTLSFDIAALEIFLPLVSGGKLVVARSEEARDPARLAALMTCCGCTVVQATPATWRGLLAMGWTGDSGLTILCGGEALAPDLAAALRPRCAGLWNMYGPTETTIWSLRHKIEADGETVPIGRPLANTRAYILDENGAPVPDLVAGELMIAGDGLARGYRGDANLTAQKFVTAPWSDGERLYRTGDRARYRRDETIEFLGRTDNQVKIRGFRVGLEEVENAIAAHPAIAACAVRANADASGELGLTAYIGGATLRDDDIPAIRDLLRRTLPAYMVPTNFMVLAGLPLMPNGKVDRKKLPATQILGAAEAGQPRNALEIDLVAIWKDVLGLRELGIHDNFFDLGGHSLLASILVARIQTELGYELPLAVLFRSPTIANLAQSLQSEDGPAFSHLVGLRAGTGRPVFIVHGIFGNVLQLKELAELLSTTRPIYAIQARGADPRQEPHGSIAEMVAAYLKAVRSAQASGPYALAGYSFGGLIAFEMARALRAEGEAVELLAVLETDLYTRYLPWRDKVSYRFLLAQRVFDKLRALPARAIPAYLMSKVSQLVHRVLLRMEWRRDFVDLDNLSGPMAGRYRQMYAIGAREFVAFRPKAYDGTLSVFRIRGPHFGACDPMPIWRRAVDAVELFEIEGDHGTIMEKPYVATLAAQFSRCLSLAQSGTPRPIETEARRPRGANLLSDSRDTALQGGS
ncbi:MAG TPA: amino acid adenylation domain-containing protein [Stellaceae bacterium]|jgi:amino acid adenylation domain-containing protein|nr:amino acid adenylation domain-containing protein [Stellaceae bacterium]